MFSVHPDSFIQSLFWEFPTVVTSLWDVLQWSPNPGFHTLVSSPPTLYQGLVCVSNSTWQKSLLRLGCKRMWLMSWPLTLLGHSLWGSQLPCLENTQVSLWRGPHGKEPRLPANSQPVNLLESSPSQAFKWCSPGQQLTAISWKTLNYNHPAKLPSGSWIQKLK